MKELSTEEKAIAYDEVIERANSLLSGNELGNAWIYKLLPELRESEDERIRKALRERIIRYDPNNEILIKEEGISQRQFIAWLEKHGEQKPTDKVEPRFKVGDRIIKNSKKSCHVHSSTDDTICEVTEVHDTYYILNTKEGRIQEPFEWQDYYELVEQDWSEEDERIYKSITYSFAHNYPLTVQQQEFVKSLKNRVQPQKHWKPTGAQLASLEIACDRNDRIGFELTELLKGLKKYGGCSMLPQWKPSDEQLTWLYRAADDASKDSRMKQVLNELLSDLKKLREK